MSRSFHSYTDLLLNLLKWPVAALSMLVLLPATVTFGEAIRQFWRHSSLGIALLVGISLFAVPLFLRKRLPRLGFWGTFEHEMTHILFALLTLHPIHSIEATHGNGGVMRYVGNGNWLITISPYFFPTFPLTVGILALALPSSLKLLGVACVGFALAWHIAATLAETHPAQTDLQNVGYIFAAVFLPGVTLLCLGFVLALVHRGGGGPVWYWAKLTGNFARTLSL